MDQKNFDNDYRTEDDCLQYIFDLKWKNGFSCFKCGHTKSWKGRTHFNRRCSKCRYDESALANTVFHKLKIPLKTAFGITFNILFFKTGVSSPDLARRFRINQKSAWYFSRKLQQALSSAKPEKCTNISGRRSLSIDSIIVSGRKSGSNGLQQVHLEVEEFEDSNYEGPQMRGEISMPNGEEKEASELLKGKFNQPNPSIKVWNFKVGLTGTHHHCSEKYMQGYKDEFMLKYNYRNRLKRLWPDIMIRLVQRSPRK